MSCGTRCFLPGVPGGPAVVAYVLPNLAAGGPGQFIEGGAYAGNGAGNLLQTVGGKTDREKHEYSNHQQEPQRLCHATVMDFDFQLHTPEPTPQGEPAHKQERSNQNPQQIELLVTATQSNDQVQGGENPIPPGIPDADIVQRRTPGQIGGHFQQKPGSIAAYLNISLQTGQQNGGNRSRVTVEMSPGVRLQVQAVE